MWSSKPKLRMKLEYFYWSIKFDLLLFATKISGPALTMLGRYQLQTRLVQVSQVEIGLNLGNSLIQGTFAACSHDKDQVDTPAVIACGVSRGRLEFGKQHVWNISAFEDKVAVHTLFKKAIIDLC